MRVDLAAAVGLLLPAAARAACGASGLADPETWESLTDSSGVERCYKFFGSSARPFGTWADCAATCQQNGQAGYDGSEPERTATIGAVRNVQQEAFVSSLLDSRTEGGGTWIGLNALEEAGENFRWAADGTRDPASAQTYAVRGEEVPEPWSSATGSWSMAPRGSGETVWVGEAGSCAATRLCMLAYPDRGQTLRGQLEQCDGPADPNHCLCEFSEVSSVGAAFDTTGDGREPACGDDMCSSWGNDCTVLESEEQVPTCRNGFTVGSVNVDTWCEHDGSCGGSCTCTTYTCCDPGTALSVTIAAANVAVDTNEDGELVDEDTCMWEMYWHYYVIANVSFYGAIGLTYLVGFGIAVRYCAARQGFSTALHKCCGDSGVCCLTCWCPCFTWGRIAEYAIDLPFWGGCLTYCCCSNLACCLGMVGRAELRKKLGMGGAIGQANGDCCADCCIHCCAHSCALCQEAREIELVHSGRRPVPAPLPMGMLPLHAAGGGGFGGGGAVTVQAQIVEPVQGVAAIGPVAGVPVAVATAHAVAGGPLPGQSPDKTAAP